MDSTDVLADRVAARLSVEPPSRFTAARHEPARSLSADRDARQTAVRPVRPPQSAIRNR